MSRTKSVVGALLVVSVFIVGLSVVDAMIKVRDPDQETFDCTGATSDPECICESVIGDEHGCGGTKTDTEGGTTGWTTECTDVECTGEITCSNGTKLTCTGEFKAYADKTGIRCIDTGSDPGDSAYCPD